MKIAAFLLTCPGRAAELARTLDRLAATDWGEIPAIHCDRAALQPPWRSIAAATRILLEKALATGADYLLTLEDDIAFNRHLRHNLTHWPALRDGRLHLATLYNPGIRAADGGLPPPRRDSARDYAALPDRVIGSQGMIHSRACVAHLLARWDGLTFNQDRWRPRQASTLGPVLVHRPSLVQHLGRESHAAHSYHRAIDFDPAFRAEG